MCWNAGFWSKASEQSQKPELEEKGWGWRWRRLPCNLQMTGGGFFDGSYGARLLEGDFILAQRPINSLEKRSMSFSNPCSKNPAGFFFPWPQISTFQWMQMQLGNTIWSGSPSSWLSLPPFLHGGPHMRIVASSPLCLDLFQLFTCFLSVRVLFYCYLFVFRVFFSIDSCSCVIGYWCPFLSLFIWVERFCRWHMDVQHFRMPILPKVKSATQAKPAELNLK